MIILLEISQLIRYCIIFEELVFILMGYEFRIPSDYKSSVYALSHTFLILNFSIKLRCIQHRINKITKTIC